MNYYQGVVLEYLRADRSVFVNEECCVQLNPGDNPDVNGPHWYCDALAVDFKNQSVFLCEITYSASLQSLAKRPEGLARSLGLCAIRARFVIAPCQRNGMHVRGFSCQNTSFRCY